MQAVFKQAVAYVRAWCIISIRAVMIESLPIWLLSAKFGKLVDKVDKICR